LQGQCGGHRACSVEQRCLQCSIPAEEKEKMLECASCHGNRHSSCQAHMNGNHFDAEGKKFLPAVAATPASLKCEPICTPTSRRSALLTTCIEQTIVTVVYAVILSKCVLN